MQKAVNLFLFLILKPQISSFKVFFLFSFPFSASLVCGIKKRINAIWDFCARIAIYLTSQNFIKLGKIRMGKRKEKKIWNIATWYFKYGYILKRQKEEGKYEHN